MKLLLKNLLFTLLAPGTVAVYVPWIITRGRRVASFPLFLASGLVLFGIGAAAYGWCLWDFASFGRGTPLIVDAPKKLVIRGLYRYNRNPMYLGVIMVILGWAALFASAALLAYAAFFAIVCHVFVVLHEERKLQRRFGAEYDAYCKLVGRWLPRSPRSPAV